MIIKVLSNILYIILPENLVGEMREKYNLRKNRNYIKFVTFKKELNLIFEKRRVVAIKLLWYLYFIEYI